MKTIERLQRIDNHLSEFARGDMLRKAFPEITKESDPFGRLANAVASKDIPALDRIRRAWGRTGLPMKGFGMRQLRSEVARGWFDKRK